MVHNIVEQIVLDLLRNQTIGETMGTRITKLLDSYAAADSLATEIVDLGHIHGPLFQLLWVKKRMPRWNNKNSLRIWKKEPK